MVVVVVVVDVGRELETNSRPGIFAAASERCPSKLSAGNGPATKTVDRQEATRAASFPVPTPPPHQNHPRMPCHRPKNRPSIFWQKNN